DHVCVAQRLSDLGVHRCDAGRAAGAAYSVHRAHPSVLAEVADGSAVRYLAQVTMISTSMRGSASFASTVARAGRLAGSARAAHVEFISSRLRMSATPTLAERIFDLLVPAAARSASIFFSTCSVCPLTPCERSSAPWPATKTSPPCSTAALKSLLG